MSKSQLDEKGLATMRMVVERMGLSARSYHCTHKLSDAIADLAGSGPARQSHLDEVWQYWPRTLL